MVFAVCLVFSPTNLDAQNKKKKRKKDATTEAVVDAGKTGKTKSIAELVKSSKKIDGLFPIYQDTITGSIQLLISEDQIGKDYIYFSQIADGVLDAGRMNRGSYRGSKVFKIEKYFNTIEFITQNTSFYFDPENALSKSKDANISQGVLASIKIESQDTENGLFLIKADDLFLKETWSQIKPSSNPKSSSSTFKLGSLSKEKTKIRKIKNYAKNTDLVIEYVYSTPQPTNNGSNAVADARNVSIKVYHSLIAIPENDYQVRFDDPRVGYFMTQVDDQTSTSTTPYRDIIHRWHLKKKNPELEISEPVEPIVWWMENSTPIEWREIIKEGVLQWNKAFEKAGFKNAIVVKQQPDDATWDAGDLQYNVLRWTSSPNPPFGGYGPSLVNPKTGQILGADIMLEFVHFTNRVFYDKLYEPISSTDHNASEHSTGANHQYCSMGHQLHQDLQFAQAAALAAEDSDMELKRLKKEAMLALIMHEVGHTLGLNHNMKASQLFSPEQLADPEFIQGKCLSASVMDYAALNITKDRSKQGQYTDVTVGPYDIWAIQFGYTPFKSKQEKQDLLNKSTNHELNFGNDADDMRSSSRGIDPRVMVSDLSSDAISYAVDRIELSDDLMGKLKFKFVKNDQYYDALKRAFFLLNSQKGTMAKVISRYIGGVYVERNYPGQEQAKQPYTPVSLEDQKRAMAALKKYVFAPDAFKSPNELYNYLAEQRRGFDFRNGPEDPKIHKMVLGYQKQVLDHLLHPNTLQRIVDSELYGNEYSLAQVMKDLNDAIFKADVYSAQINSFRQNLQLEYVNELIAILSGKSSGSYVNNAKSMALYNLNEIKKMANNTGDLATKAHKLHLRTLIDNALDEMK
ncbi:DUF5117 domain-containing protein [Tamlana crocina]|uniref:DUF5117 domain-containing protein n=2 Tax=Tamlana crocina TaxID=393006 RepID=A0ABX1DAS5_9FLAO|nr:DUF5117 domain-containing protein [Tamlana crocina]